MTRQSQHQTGSSLLEMMISLFVLAIGLLGVLSMQVKSLQFNQSAYYYSQAAYLANDIVESMRSTPETAKTYLIGLEEPDPGGATDCETKFDVCSSGQMRDWVLAKWRANVASTLSAGRSSISNNGDFYTVTVQFDDSRSEAAGGEDLVLSEYVLVTEIN